MRRLRKDLDDIFLCGNFPTRSFQGRLFHRGYPPSFGENRLGKSSHVVCCPACYTIMVTKQKKTSKYTGTRVYLYLETARRMIHMVRTAIQRITASLQTSVPKSLLWASGDILVSSPRFIGGRIYGSCVGRNGCWCCCRIPLVVHSALRPSDISVSPSLYVRRVVVLLHFATTLQFGLMYCVSLQLSHSWVCHLATASDHLARVLQECWPWAEWSSTPRDHTVYFIYGRSQH